MNLCPICSSNKIEPQKVKEVFEYKGQRKEFENYEIFRCNSCEEEFVNEDYLKTIKKEIRDFHHEVDGLLTSYEIKRIRKEFGYNQEDFGNLLGGGKKAFARYENGSVSQSRPMNNLLKVIDKMPEALDVLQRG